MNKKISKILGVGLTIALLASLMVVAPVSALTQPSVTPTSATISATTSYSVLFTLGKDVAEGGKIVVAFPTGTDLTNVSGTSASGNVTIAATSGIGSTAFGSTNATSAKTPTAAGPTLTITVPDVNAENKIGVGAIVQVVVANVLNPATAGSYTLTVGTLTSADVVIEAAVTSAAYEIKVPTIAALPGIVSVYNVASVLVSQGTGSTAIATAIGAATATGFTIKIGPGTYTENPDTAVAGVTFVATGTAAETIIKGTFNIDVDKTTLDGLTIQGKIIATTASTNVTIKNSIVKPTSATAADTLLAIADVPAASPVTITNTSFAVTGATPNGITILAPAKVSVTDSIFTVDTGGKGIASDGTLTVTNGTFTGSSGTGIDVYGGTATVTGATFDNLTTALNVATGGVLTAKKNTIKNSTGDAIAIAGAATKVTITGNDISATVATKYAVNLAADVDADTNVFVVFNNITGNTLNVKNADTTEDKLNATHNWWGVATGPATTSISGDVNTSGYLTVAATVGTGAVVTASATLTGKTTAGVDVVATGGPPAIIAASKYGDNPVAVAPPYPALTGGYFDVYVGTPGATTAIDIKLYGAVAADTAAYAWSALQGKWVKVTTQGVNTFGGFVYITLTTTSTPAIADLSGLPFALVSGPPAAPVTFALTAPAAGATMPITNVAFTWASVTGATSYKLVISANADLSTPIVTATAAGTAYTYSGTLDYSTPYYWQVTALKDTTVLGKSDIATFITVAKPVVVKPTAAVVPFGIVRPAIGETVSIEPVLSWTVFEGAIGYEVMVSTDSKFAIIDYSHNVAKDTTFYKSETLSYGTTYYWRVRGVTGPAPAKKAAPGGDWANGIFITQAKPVPPAKVEPTVIVQKEAAPPAQVIEVPVQTVVPQPIPNYLLWVIIVVGAVLIIALIVLIARTRRVT